MNAKVRVWHLVVIAAGVAVGWWFLLPSAPPPPPDFTSQGFVSVRVELRGLRSTDGVLSASSDNPAVVAELADVLRSGQPVMLCRCAALGSLEFRRPDGTAERVTLMPAHNVGAVEFRAGSSRYQVSRERFLKTVEALVVPADRWYKFPEADSD